METERFFFEIRPHRGGWQCFEAPGVEPYFVGDGARASAIRYAESRSALRVGEIRILRADGSLEDQRKLK